MSLKTVKEGNLEGSVRDGTVLRADVYRPEGSGRYPTLLCRTPYDKERREELGRKLAELGYTVAIQDVRGRHASDGVFRPGLYSAEHDDAEDGYDAVEWTAALPWSTGRVATYGGSYEGWTQWELAHTRPPHLETMLVSGIAANLLDRELSGVLRLGRVLDWTVNNLSVDTARRLEDRWKTRDKDEARRLWHERDRLKWLWYLPLYDIPEETMPGMHAHWRRWLDDHASDHFGFLGKHKDVDVPVLHLTGWYDQQIGTIKHFTGMVQNGMTEDARENQYLVVGPWTHTLENLSQKVGELDFGTEAEWDFFELAHEWFSCWLAERDTEVGRWPRVRAFVMGVNTWRESDTWPLPKTIYRSYYLRSGGHAQSAAGDGSLSCAPPGEEPADAYVYDPRDPAMSMYTPEGQHAPVDLRPLDGRRDLLVYTTPPLEEPVEVLGPVVVKLWAASSARDTDFVARLIDVWPNGFTQELCYGIVRARYRDSFEQPSLIEPGKPYEYTIQVNPTGNRFLKGHRIRLDLASSDFPNFDRNHNTGGDDYREAELRSAEQTIYHDAERPSCLVLPTIPL